MRRWPSAVCAVTPADVEIDVVNETWDGPDWRKAHDLLFLTSAHSDFDRARQVSHYWRRRGATTVFGGAFASTYPELCAPFFDAICIGDAEATVPEVYADFCRGSLKPLYRGTPFDRGACRRRASICLPTSSVCRCRSRSRAAAPSAASSAC